MKYTAAILALAAAVSAQSLSDIPTCAQPCIDDARTKETSCSATDYKCICDNIDKLTAAGTSCVLSSCGADVALNKVLPAIQAFCTAVENGGGATSEPASSSSPASTSEPAQSTSAPASSSSAAASTPAGSSSAAGYPTEGSTSAPVTVTQSSYPGTTAVPTYGGNNGTATPTTSATLIPTAGAAIAGSMGGFAMLALGAMAAF
ncbi:hypothetical protein F4803DRAFT_74844 [Xylaria telfairii]|nr:hypothetical protein F4803DRAFT_74844 [Xylaria telfairii]